jgi:hypothetical protein
MSHEESSNPYQYKRETLIGRSSQSHINLPFVVYHPIFMVEHVKKNRKHLVIFLLIVRLQTLQSDINHFPRY